MDFALSDTQQEIMSLAERILRDHCTEQRLKVLESGQRFDEQLWQTLRAAGLTDLALPEESGGMAMGLFEICLVAQQMGTYTAAVPFLYHELASTVLAAHPSAAEAADLRPGETLLTLALAERATLNTLVFDEDRLSGEVSCVPYGQQAGAALLAAVNRRGETGLVFVRLDQAGTTREAQRITSGEPNALIRCGGAPASWLGGEALLGRLRAELRVGICAMQLGNLERALAMTASYTSERIQFGVPIGSFQAVGHRVADAYIAISNLRNTTWAAASELAAGRLDEALVNVAKYWCGEAGHTAMASFQQVHGGMGADRDYGLWRHTVWSKQFEMQLGSSAEMAWLLGESLAAGA